MVMTANLHTRGIEAVATYISVEVLFCSLQPLSPELVMVVHTSGWSLGKFASIPDRARLSCCSSCLPSQAVRPLARPLVFFVEFLPLLLDQQNVDATCPPRRSTHYMRLAFPSSPWQIHNRASQAASSRAQVKAGSTLNHKQKNVAYRSLML